MFINTDIYGVAKRYEDGTAARNKTTHFGEGGAMVSAGAQRRNRPFPVLSRCPGLRDNAEILRQAQDDSPTGRGEGAGDAAWALRA